MFLDKEYFERIKEAKEVVEEIHKQEDSMIELIQDTEDTETDVHELNMTAEYYVKELLADGAGRAGDANSLDSGPMLKMLKKELAHNTADTVLTLGAFDNMTMEFLFSQPAPAVADYLIEIGEEA